jgi:hypothetical protein
MQDWTGGLFFSLGGFVKSEKLYGISVHGIVKKLFHSCMHS